MRPCEFHPSTASLRSRPTALRAGSPSPTPTPSCPAAASASIRSAAPRTPLHPSCAGLNPRPPRSIHETLRTLAAGAALLAL